jgi:hypothetical protein
MNQAAQQAVTHWYSQPMTLFTFVIALSALINLFVAWRMWMSNRDSVELTRHIFESTHRPFVGVGGIAAEINIGLQRFSYLAEIRNFGSLPANSLTMHYKVVIGGSDQPISTIPHGPSVLFPDGSAHMKGFEGRPALFSAIVEGTQAFELVIDLDYKDTTGNPHHTHEKSRYRHDQRAFIKIEGTSD